MKILLLTAYAPSLANFRGPLIRDMQALGHEVHTGSPALDAVTRAEIEALGCIPHETHLARHGTGLRADIAYMRTLRKLIRRIAPDFILTYAIKPNIWGALAAHAEGVRSAAMVTGLGYAFSGAEQDGPKSRVVKWVARKLYRRATDRNERVIFQNPDDLREFIAAGCLGDPDKAALVNGSGVDLDHFRPAPLPADPVFLMVARVIGAKGVRAFAEAALDVKRTHPEACFQLLGFIDGGPDAIDPDDFARWTGNGLEYLGHTDDVRTMLAACRVFVLPSYYREGVPRSTLEALATGRPVLTTDAPGCRETVTDGVNGFLVPVRDPTSLADRMRWMLDHPAECARMAQASLDLARDRFEVHRVNATLLDHLGLAAQVAPPAVSFPKARAS